MRIGQELVTSVGDYEERQVRQHLKLKTDSVKVVAQEFYEVHSMKIDERAKASLSLYSEGEMNIKGSICKVN